MPAAPGQEAGILGATGMDNRPPCAYPTGAMSDKPALHVLLAGPRGFCAGVDRAIRVVQEALRRYGAPVYVRHEIVHNRTVVEQLEREGAVFVEDLAEVPEDAQVVFSAHGVPKSVPEEARRRRILPISTPPAPWSARSTGRRSGTMPMAARRLATS